MRLIKSLIYSNSLMVSLGMAALVAFILSVSFSRGWGGLGDRSELETPTPQSGLLAYYDWVVHGISETEMVDVDPTQSLFVPLGDLVSPGERPPVTSLVLRRSSGSGPSTHQLGILAYYEWVIDGKIEMFEMDPTDTSWPTPLLVQEGDAALLGLVTPVMPIGLEARLFRHRGVEGSPGIQPASITCELIERPIDMCNLPSSEEIEDWKLVIAITCDIPIHPSRDSCSLTPGETEDGEGWELPIPMPSSAGEYLIVLWTVWFFPPEMAPGSPEADINPYYQASWLFPVRRG